MKDDSQLNQNPIKRMDQEPIDWPEEAGKWWECAFLFRLISLPDLDLISLRYLSSCPIGKQIDNHPIDQRRCRRGEKKFPPSSTYPSLAFYCHTSTSSSFLNPTRTHFTTHVAHHSASRLFTYHSNPTQKGIKKEKKKIQSKKYQKPHKNRIKNNLKVQIKSQLTD